MRQNFRKIFQGKRRPASKHLSKRTANSRPISENGGVHKFRFLIWRLKRAAVTAVSPISCQTRRSGLGTTRRDSTKRSSPNLLAYKPIKPRGTNRLAKSQLCQDVQYPTRKGVAAISRQTPLLNTRRLLFQRLDFSRTACESHKHNKNPRSKPSSLCFTLESPP